MSNSRTESIVVAGLPGSGKTTYLAALWHLVTARDVKTVLSLGKLVEGEMSHLTAIATQWRNARVQERTPVNRSVSMSLKEPSGSPLHVAFPDVSGEVFVRMWEDRECDPELVPTLQAESVALFVHADTIQPPRWIAEETELAEDLGLKPVSGPIAKWKPRDSPTQVQLVDILQLLRTAPLDVGPRRLTVMLSAWDKAVGERLTPDAFLAAKLPLLDQYLRQGADGWEWRVYGVSAQGGDYDPAPTEKNPAPPSAGAEALRSLDCASERIRVVHGDLDSHDLTEPLAWLIS